ncbi:hypothetical protein E5Q_02983 [Mixia osmundae IAM 14324]|uniref:Ferrochelatase n=1 Tax=Mixia osmundae (strain CBS 9802 / IAM 14324 / JCM 22182 / KY 12970) TaxID=764103 RepID=G7E0F7_MIXOS|nr:hypothetical protein E5Q_02983 [Mixia osmundae IAM 14324]
MIGLFALFALCAQLCMATHIKRGPHRLAGQVDDRRFSRREFGERKLGLATKLLTDQWATQDVCDNKYTVMADKWNQDSGSGSQSTQVYECNAGKAAFASQWQWQNAQDQVKTYSSVALKSTQNSLQQPISNYKSLQSSWSWTVEGPADAHWDVSFDIWLGTAPNDGGSSAVSAFEIMVWTGHQNAAPVGPQIGTVTLQGTTWTVHAGPVSHWTCISFVAPDNIEQYQGDVLDFVRWGVENVNGLNDELILNAVEAGTEAFIDQRQTLLNAELSVEGADVAWQGYVYVCCGESRRSNFEIERTSILREVVMQRSSRLVGCLARNRSNLANGISARSTLATARPSLLPALGCAPTEQSTQRRTLATPAAERASLTGIDRSTSNRPPTGVVFMNMGGPSTVPETGDFLSRLFHDGDLIPLPFQRFLAPAIAKRRTPKIEKQYEAIGGGSPILRWTKEQAKGMVELLDELSPATAPHKAYVAFRYARPLTEDCLDEMARDGVTKAVAFTQYPQYSCSTTGSSLNEMYAVLKQRQELDKIEWSVIDRWPTHAGLIDAVARNIEVALQQYPADKRDDVVLLFSAHSLPMSVVNRGDPYPAEVASTVHAVMTKLGHSHQYRLVWQSSVGPSAWLGPQTSDSIKGLAKLGHNDVLLVPIAFTSDHIETLYELDVELMEEAHELGMTGVKRVESLNASPIFIRALADIAAQHLESGKVVSKQMMLRCPQCTSERCGPTKAYFARQ